MMLTARVNRGKSMEVAIIILVLLGWFVAPIALTVVCIKQAGDKKRLLSLLSEKDKMLNDAMHHNEVLRKRIGDMTGGVPVEANYAVDSAPTEAVNTPNAIETMPAADAPNAIETMPAANMPNAMGMPGPASMAEIMNRTKTFAGKERSGMPAQNVAMPDGAQTAYSASAPNMNRASALPVDPVAQYANDKFKEMQPISVGAILFGIGTLLVLLAGAIFATTSWKVLTSGGKIAVLLGAVAVFFVGALIAAKKLKLRNTSITFYILGSTFLAVTNLAAGYFGWYGIEWLDVKNQLLIWALSSLITSACLIIGALLYKTKVLGVFGYNFMALGVILFTAFATSNMYIFAIVTGLFLILSRVYVRLVEYNTENDAIGFCVDMYGYVQNLLVLLLALVYKNNLLDSDFAKDWAVILLSILVTTINLCMIIWQTVMAYKSSLSKGKAAREVLAVVSTSLAILAVGIGDRIFSDMIYRLMISTVIYLVLMIVTAILERKKSGKPLFRWICEGYTLALVALMVIVSLDYTYYIDRGVLLLVILVIALSTYIVQHINKNTCFAFITAASLMALIIEITRFFDLQKIPALCSSMIYVLVAVLVIAGRLLYGKIVSFNDEHKYIDWISVFSAVLVLYAIGVGFGSRTNVVPFTVLLLASLYFVSYVGRINEVVDKVMLTITSIWAMFIIAIQPFFEIPYELETEWGIAFLLGTTAICGFIWRKYSKAYRYVWAVVIGIAFFAQFGNVIDSSPLTMCVIKLVVYIIGMIVLFGVAFLKKSKLLMVEAGFVLALSSLLGFDVDVAGIFVLISIMSVGYLFYLYYADMAIWTFLPMLQLYLVLGVFDIPVWAWLITFILTMLLGVIIRYAWGKGRSFVRDWANIFGIVAIFAVAGIGDNDRWYFCALMMFVVYTMSFYRRYIEDSKALVNKVILSVASGFSALAWINQPWLNLPDVIVFEWCVIGIIGFCLINMLAIYRSMTSELWGWITYGVSIVCVLVQAVTAIGTGDVIDALILGISMLILLIISFAAKKKQWFLLAAITLVAQSIYASRRFWLSIAWWVYLLAAGAILITIAARSEYKKRTAGPDANKVKKHWFADWTL